MSATRHIGSCACGLIRVEVAGPLGALIYCHCTQCRQTAGAPFIAVVPAARADCMIDDPESAIREFRATPGKARCFCGRCGAPLFSYRDGADTLRLRAGLFETLPGVIHGGHIFVADAASWDDICDELPRYAGLEPGRSGPT